jgi:hypothetical protein
VEAHDITHGIVEHEGEEVEVDDGVQALGKVVEKRGEIALLGDGLADFQQGFELTPGVFQRGGERHFRRRNNGVRHTRQDNTRIGEGSTCAMRNNRYVESKRRSGIARDFTKVPVAPF